MSADPNDLTFASEADRAEAIAHARKRGRNEGPTPRQWAAALIETRGLKWRAAHMLSASPNTLNAALEKHHALAEVAADARERMLDDAEAKLAAKAIDDGDGECLRYLLKTLGRNRGYGEKVEHSVNVVDGADVLAGLAKELGKADAADQRRPARGT